ncbi:MAG: NAD regulator, partial [Alphaproteobacteria bacterium]|nr:NAD regulator [Alphaproteobacteria bacterium]
MSPAEQHAVAIGLSAAIVSVTEEQPSVLVVRHPEDGSDALPFGPFNPLQHRTLESGLRKWVGEQTYLDLGYAEQLYTFGDRGRHEMKSGEGPRVVSVGYLALTRQGGALNAPDTLWRDWYRYFPWEDWRGEKPAVIADAIVPALKLFVKAAPDGPTAELRRDRMRLCFGLDGLAWDEEKVLERYE